MRARKEPKGTFVKELPERVILLSDTLEAPALDNLWNYLSRFYEMVPADLKDRFCFEDQAGIYTENGTSRLFAVCVRHAELEGLRVLPEGKYLCASCTEEDRGRTLAGLTARAKTEFGAEPRFTVQLIVVSGILQWNYEAQVFVGR